MTPPTRILIALAALECSGHDVARDRSVNHEVEARSIETRAPLVGVHHGLDPDRGLIAIDPGAPVGRPDPRVCSPR